MDINFCYIVNCKKNVVSVDKNCLMCDQDTRCKFVDMHFISVVLTSAFSAEFYFQELYITKVILMVYDKSMTKVEDYFIS